MAKDTTSCRGETEGLLSSIKQMLWEVREHREVKCWLRKGERSGPSSSTISLGFWLLKVEIGCEYQGRNLK